MSAESGIKTFRDSDGLWENYKVEDVATIDAWHCNPELMVDFYNARRREVQRAEPNLAHQIIGELQQDFDVTVITQNIDNLHERGGAKEVIHLHGEITKVCSERGKRYVKDIGFSDFAYGDRAEDGTLLRPFIVWFGEDVPLLQKAAEIVEQADILVIIGTSLVVYPAASLLYYAPKHCPIYLIDPSEVQPVNREVNFIRKPATEGMRILKEELLKCK